MIQLAEGEVTVQIFLRRVVEDQDYGTMTLVAENERHGGSVTRHQPYDELRLYAYECVRLERSRTFADVNAQWFQKHWRSGRSGFRTFHSKPIKPGGQKQPIGALVILIKPPYALSGEGNELDERLDLYVELANIYLRKELSNGPRNSQPAA